MSVSSSQGFTSRTTSDLPTTGFFSFPPCLFHHPKVLHQEQLPIYRQLVSFLFSWLSLLLPFSFRLPSFLSLLSLLESPPHHPHHHHLQTNHLNHHPLL